MKKRILIVLASLLILIPIGNYASELIPHEFSSGDTISADMMNEILEKVKYVSDGFSSPSELVGNWSCTSVSPNVTKAECVSYFTLSTSGLYRSKAIDVTFTDDGDGTYSFTSDFLFWTCVGNKTGTGDYDVYGNKLFINSFSQDT